VSFERPALTIERVAQHAVRKLKSGIIQAGVDWAAGGKSCSHLPALQPTMPIHSCPDSMGYLTIVEPITQPCPYEYGRRAY
jgi:hypothetical protein